MFDANKDYSYAKGHGLTTVKSTNLYQRWIDAKEAEKAAIDLRRSLEDELVMDLDIAKTLDGTQNIETDGYKIKVVGRLERKVNAYKLQDLAAEHGLTQHLTSLFRWKP